MSGDRFFARRWRSWRPEFDNPVPSAMKLQAHKTGRLGSAFRLPNTVTIGQSEFDGVESKFPRGENQVQPKLLHRSATLAVQRQPAGQAQGVLDLLPHRERIAHNPA